MLIHKLIALTQLRPGIVQEGPASGNAAGGGAEGEGSAGGAPGESSQGGSEPGSGSPAEGASGGEPASGSDGASGAGEAVEDLVIKLGDEELPAAEEAAPWVKDLRRRFREQSQELARLRNGAAPAAAAAQGLPPAPGAKPKLSDPDIDFDADKLVVALDKWHEASNKHSEAKRKASDQQAQEQRAWEQTVAAYQEAGAKLGFADFADCEAAATAALSETQAAIIVQGAESAEKAALIMYSLGRSMKLLQDLAKVQDPVKFAFAVADIQRKLVMLRRKPNTKPESSLPASSVSAAAALAGEDKKVAELRDEAARTGDMSKLLSYQRQQRQKQAARR